MENLNLKYTPGPWTYKATAGNHDFSIYSEIEPTRRDVALVRDFDEANARLIAAAPDMLEALEDAENTLHVLGDFAGDVPEWNKGGEFYESLQFIKAAIAKARA